MASCKPVSLAFNIFEASEGIDRKNPIIFLHGLTGYKEHWVDIPKKVAEATHRTVYALDARNHGESEWSEEFSFDLNAVDLMHFIEQIAAEKVTLVGHSMGGVTCMKMALKIPTKIDKIISEDMGITIPAEVSAFVRLLLSIYQEFVLELPKYTTRKEAAKGLNKFAYDRVPDEAKPLFKNNDRDYEILKRNSDGSISFRSNLNVLKKAVENEDTLISKYEGVFDGPACFIYGEESFFHVDQDAESIKKFFPNAQFVGIEGATHDVHTDAPQHYIDALLKFLKE